NWGKVKSGQPHIGSLSPLWTSSPASTWLAVSGLLRGVILVGSASKSPCHRFRRRLDAGRHAQIILTRGRGIPHLDVAGDILRVARQLHLVEHAMWSAIDKLPLQFPDEAVAHTLLDDAAHLDVWLLEEIFARQLLVRQDDLLRHLHAVPGPEAPAVRVLDGGPSGAGQPPLPIGATPPRPAPARPGPPPPPAPPTHP